MTNMDVPSVLQSQIGPKSVRINPYGRLNFLGSPKRSNAHFSMKFNVLLRFLNFGILRTRAGALTGSAPPSQPRQTRHAGR